jgi:predicted phage baseplate assembly protein
VVSDAAGRPLEIWVRWHEVPDFYSSGPRDRHYAIDHLTGEVRFGDGQTGRIPPLGANNVRMASYRTGGGASGNRAAGTVTQLKTTVPYVEKPTNPEPAAGGAEAETVDAVRERVPRTLRHRDRAVTVEDYEDMAKLASLEVAHARCIPLRDLDADPLGAAPVPGMASVIVVPLSTDAKPLPSLELVARAETFLKQRIPAGASVVVVGPRYIRIDVTVDVGITADAVVPVVKATIEERIVAFLHPLTGGLDGKGWDFGRIAHRSDLYPLIESVSGVDHTRFLHVSEVEELDGIRQTGCFLIYSGQHQINAVFEET